ncbi:MAG: 50S ribosomal protein L30 [Vicinamibacteraceae bacterium]
MANSGKAATLRIKQVRSIIGYDKKQGQVVRGLGLRRIGHEVDVIDHPAMRGMIQKVRHIVTVVPAGAENPAGAEK